MIIEAKDFVKTKVEGRYYFGGCDREQTVAVLERFIEGVRDGRVLLQGVTISSKMNIAEYLMNDLTITYAETEQPFPKENTILGGTNDLKELYGNYHFPVEIQKVGD